MPCISLIPEISTHSIGICGALMLHIRVQCITDQYFPTIVLKTGCTGKDNVFIITHHCDYWHSDVCSSLNLCSIWIFPWPRLYDAEISIGWIGSILPV